MHGPREALNELKWRLDALHEAEIHYVHRGAPSDSRVVQGARIVELGRSFFTLRDRRGVTSIPYHRVYRIERGGETVWKRRLPGPPPGT